MHYAMPSPLGEELVVNDFTTHILRYDEPDCVTGETVSTLLVQEDKRYLEGRNPEPQLIAEVVAISQFHNSQLHLTWTAPIFYNCSCRMLSIQPKLPIFALSVQRPLGLQKEGLRSLGNGVVILSCFK